MFKEYKLKGTGFAFLGLLFGLGLEILIFQLAAKSQQTSFLVFITSTSLNRLYATVLLFTTTISGLVAGNFFLSYREEKKRAKYLAEEKKQLKDLTKNQTTELDKIKHVLKQDSGMFVANWDELVREKDRYREEAAIAQALLKVAASISSLEKPDKALRLIGQVLPVILYADACLIFARQPDGSFSANNIKLTPEQPAIKVVLSQKIPVAVNQQDKDKLFNSDLVSQLKLQSALIIPCLSKETVIALAMVLYTKSAFNLGKKEISIAQGIVEQITVVLENATLYQEVAEQQQQLQRLLEKLALAQEDERRRIARDLHDGVVQDLSGIIFALSFLSSSLPQDNSKAHQEIEQLTKVVDTAIGDIRQIIYDLRPTTLDSLGLVPTLEKYLERFSAKYKVKTKLEANLKKRLPEKVETTVFRLTQEALNNIAKYAQAENVLVKLSQENGVLKVSIKDDGVGFDLNEAKNRNSQTSGFGLSGMQERVRLVNGQLTIDSALGQGCQVAATIPLA